MATNYKTHKDRIAWLIRLGQTRELELIDGHPRLAVSGGKPELCQEIPCHNCELFGALTNECYTPFIDWCMQEVDNE